MRRGHLRMVCVGAAALLALAACSSSGKSGSGGSSDTAGGGTITAGVLSEVTGSGVLGHSIEDGVKARFALQNADGGVGGKKLAYKIADTTSTVPGALSAAQTLVQKDHVLGVLSASSFTQGAVDYLKSQSVPLVGVYPSSPNFGDPSYTNMFAINGSGNPHYAVTTTYGEFFKSQGVSKLADVSYATAAGANAAKAVDAGAKSVGLDVAYENTNLPLGTTDVASLALSIKKSGADGIWLPLLPSTSIALLTELKKDGVNLKAALLLLGYGQDTLASAPAVKALQGVDFEFYWQPFEAHTPATQQEAAALKKYAGVTGEPYYMDTVGWVLADAFIRGLQAAGSNPTQASFTSGLRKVHDYTAGGLYTKPVDFSEFGNLGVSVGPGNCINVLQLEGNAFHVIPSANPVCGTTTGKTVG